MHRVTALTVFVVVAIVVAACGADDPLRSAFPDVAQRALADGGVAFVRRAQGFVEPAPGDPVVAAHAALERVAAILPIEGEDSFTLGLVGGFSVQVRERGLFGPGEAGGGHVRYARGDGVVYWSRSGDGLEEWLHVVTPHAGVLATWEMVGARFEPRADAVAVVDEGGRDRIRVTAPEAWGASGARLAVRLEVRDDILALVVGDAAAEEEEILVDPLWSPVGSMATARERFTATALPNGKVLVAGGVNSGGYVALCELYDPGSGLWSPAQAMGSPRGQHAAVLLQNGNVLVSGGRNSNGVLATTEWYLPATDTWVNLQPMPHAHSGHTATLLASGKVLVVGGLSSAAELFNPTTRVWTATGSPSTLRNDFTATRIPGAKVLVVGGFSAGTYLATAEIYSEASGQWATTTSMPGGRANHSATLLRSGEVLVVGGRNAASYLNSASRFNPATQQWTPTSSLAEARVFHTATLLPNDRVLVVGGYNVGGEAASDESFNPSTGAWSATPSPSPRHNHIAVLLESGRVLIAGGNNGNTIASAYVVDPAFGHDSWSGFVDLPSNFLGSVTLLSDGTVLLVGRWRPAGQPLDPGTLGAKRFYPATGMTVSTGPRAFETDSHTASLLSDGRVLVAGGTGGDGETNACDLYDPATNTWSPTAALHHARAGATSTLLPSGQVLVIGGMAFGAPWDFLAFWLPPPELYDPVAQSWTEGPVGFERRHHTATLLPDGNVLVVGGVNTVSPGAPAVNSAPVINSTTLQVQSWTLMQNARCDHTTTALPDGRLVVAGGHTFGCGTLSDGFSSLAPLEVFSPSSGSWATAGDMAMSRIQHTATLLPNGLVMFTGGYHWGAPGSGYALETELFDPATGQSTTVGLKHPSHRRPTLLLPNNKVAQMGWCWPQPLSDCDPQQIWLYDEGRLATTTPTLSFAPASASAGSSFTLNGSGFIVDAEGTQGAATHLAVVQMDRFESETRVMAPIRSVTSTSATAVLPSTAQPGWYQVRIVVDGIPSIAKIVRVD